MKFAIGLENTKDSFELFENFFKNVKFCRSYTLDVFIIQECEWQENEIEVLKKKINEKLEKENVKGEIIVDKGDPVTRVAKLIEKRKIDLFVCRYEHSIMRGSFFEGIMKETGVPVLTLR